MAKGKWQQCIDSSYALESLDGKRTLFSADVRNTCTVAKRCGWKCREQSFADAQSLYEVNLTELVAVTLAGRAKDSGIRDMSLRLRMCLSGVASRL